MVDQIVNIPEDLSLPGSASPEEARLMHDIVSAARTLPEGVNRVAFRFGEDSTGTPSVWIVLKIDDDIKPPQQKLAAIRRLAEDVRSQVRAAGMSRWPYVAIETDPS